MSHMKRPDEDEPARTEWIAAQACEKYTNRVPIERIESEALEAAVSVFSAELQDRDRRFSEELAALINDQEPF